MSFLGRGWTELLRAADIDDMAGAEAVPATRQGEGELPALSF